MDRRMPGVCLRRGFFQECLATDVRALWSKLCLLVCFCTIFGGQNLNTVQAEDVLSIGFAEAAPGVRNVPVLVTATHDDPLHGYSVAFSFESPAIRLANISISGTHIGPLQPEFVAPRIDNRLGVGSLGVIFEFSEPFELSELPPSPEGRPIIVAILTMDVAAQTQGGTYEMKLANGIGSPPSFNRFTHAGQSIAPRLEDGSITVTGGNLLQLEKKRAIPGATPNLQIFALASHAAPLDGFQIGFTFDKNALTLKDQSFSGTDVFFELGTLGIESFNFDLDETFGPITARATTAALFDGEPPFGGQTLSPALASPPEQSIARYTFDVSPSAAVLRQFHNLTLEDTEIPGAIDNRFLIGGRSLDPTLVSGRIYFSTGNVTGRVVDSETQQPLAGVVVTTVPDGIRTTTSTAGRFTLSDIPAGLYALRLERAGFYNQRVRRVLVNGSSQTEETSTTPMFKIPENPLQDFVRGDCDGDGEISGVTDSIVMLNFNFQGGNRPGCIAACDADGDGSFIGVLTDAIFLLNFQFQGGAPPGPPYPACGASTNPSDLELGCERRALSCR